MRTTLDIADDVLLAAKEVARREKRTVGEVVSMLARSSLLRPPSAAPGGKVSKSTAQKLARLGITPLPRRGGIVTEELINRIREEEGI